MERAYINAGFNPSDFWELTPRMYWNRMNGAKDRLEREEKARVELAYLTAVLTRAKKVPSLKRLLNGNQPEKVSISEGFARIREMAKRARKEEWQQGQ